MWRAPLYPSWKDMLATHEDAELAYVFAPHDTMHKVCLALIERRIPLVVEKPAGVSLQQVRDIRTAAEAAGVAITVPLVQREGPTDAWLAHAGTAVYESVQFIAGPPGRYLANGSPWMVDAERAGGGCMINLAPHFVDLFLRSTGAKRATVTAALSSALHHGTVEDFASLTLSTADGRVATIEVGYAFPDSELKRYCSHSSAGEAGFASIDTDGSATFTTLDGRTERAVIDVDSDPLHDPFVREVARTLGAGFRGLPTLGELEDVMRIIWRAYEADREEGHHG